MSQYENLSPEALSSLVDASRAINAHQTLEETLGAIARSAAAVMKTEASSVIMLDKARGKQVFRATVGDRSDQLIGVEYDQSVGISGKAIREGVAVTVDDVTKEKSFYKEIDAMTSFHTRAVIAAPLIHQGEILGVVEVINPVQDGTRAEGSRRRTSRWRRCSRTWRPSPRPTRSSTTGWPAKTAA